MKKILMISLLFSLTVGFVACDDNKDEYLSDYSTIVYFRNSGEIPLTLYKTGEDTEYQPILPVKSGRCSFCRG